MKIQRNDELTKQLLAEMMAEIEDPERKSQHPSVTDLIDCLTKTYWNSTQDRIELSDRTKMYFIIGLGLEQNLLVARKKTPVYGSTDGIHWHVDSLDAGIQGERGLLELKGTRMGPPKSNEDEPRLSERWLRQVKSYLYANDLTEVDFAIIHIIQAELIVWHLSFTDVELTEHWNWMQHRKAVWEDAQDSNEAPASFKYNEDWECKDCQYKLLCELRASLAQPMKQRLRIV